MSRTKRGGSQRRSSRSLYSRGDAAYVSLFCAEGHDKWLIGSLVGQVHDDALVWVESSTGYYSPDSPTLLPVSGRMTQWLIGDQWVSTETRDAPSAGSFRTRWAFRCQQCALGFNVARKEALFPVLGALFVAGVREVPLVTLAKEAPRIMADTRGGEDTY